MNFTLAKFCVRLFERLGKKKARLYVKRYRNIISKKLNKTRNCNYLDNYLLNFEVYEFNKNYKLHIYNIKYKDEQIKPNQNKILYVYLKYLFFIWKFKKFSL